MERKHAPDSHFLDGMKVFELFRLDAANHCLWHEDARVPLTPKAFDILRYLVENANRLVSQDEILEALWPETYVNPEGVRKYILEIRKALGDRPGEPSFIQTLPKRGYQFIAEVSEEQAPPRAVGEGIGNMVGRDAALASLREHFESAMRGQRQVFFVTGEAGFGKTTLVDAFLQQIAGHTNLRVARGQCIEGFGGTEAYSPMLEAVGSLVLHGRDGSFLEVLARQAPTWLAQFPSLVNPGDRDWLQREISGSRPGRMIREICEALEAVAADRPLILILEDLHWVDSSTVDLISALARRRESAKLLLIGTYRPAEVAVSKSPLNRLKEDLLVRHLCREIEMERLDECDVAEYLEREFPRHRFPASLANLIHQNSGGNPLFMTAILRDIVKRGLIARDREAWALGAPLEEVDQGIPETLQQVLDAQFLQLSPEEQRTLECCSVAGERFSVWAAAAMLELPVAAVEEICDRLVRLQQFIRFAGIHPAPDGANLPQYEFRHSLYRQALYGRLSSAARSDLHRALADRLMAAYSIARPELASELALHFEEGRNYEPAVRCFILAAENDSHRFAHGNSIRVLQHALELVPLVAHEQRIELEIRILQRIGDAQYALGAISDSIAAYESAAARAAESGMRRSQIETLARLAVPAWYLDPTRGNDVCEQAIEVSKEYADPLLLARTQLAAPCFRLMYDAWRKEDAEACRSARQTIHRLGASSIPEDLLYAYVQYMQGEYEEALQKAEAGMLATTDSASYLLALGVKTLILLALGRYGELLRIVRTGRMLAEKNGEDPWLFIFRETCLRAHCYDYAGVRRLSEMIMRSDTDSHALEPRAIAQIASGYAELNRGRCEPALQLFVQASDPKTTSKFLFNWWWRMRAQLASIDACLQGGDLQRASLEVGGFLESARSIEDPTLHAYAWERSAQIAVAYQDYPRALECIESALEVLNKLDGKVRLWRVNATAWDLYSYLGEKEKAEWNRKCAQEVIMRLADSFEPDEPLRASLLAAGPVRRVLGQAEACKSQN